MVDDNFLVDLDRARDISAGLVRAGREFPVEHPGNDQPCRPGLSLEDLKLLRRSGLHQICQGAESGSPKVLEAMNKDFQDFDSIYESAARCLAAGIRPSFNIIFAFPGEGRAERRETVRFIMDMCRRFPGAEFWTNIFTPYPGAPVMERAKEIGIEVPTSFEGWADFFPRYTKLPWLNGRDHHRLQVMRDYLRIAFDRVPIAADRRSRFTRTAQKCISLPARWRLDHDAIAFPVELWINDKLNSERSAMKPVVDAKRLEPAAGTGGVLMRDGARSCSSIPPTTAHR